MKFAHTADWHLGANRRGRRRVPNYLRRQTDGILAVFQSAREHGLDLVVVAGDLFDSKTVEPRELNACATLLMQQERLGMTILVVRGNHDEYSTGQTYLSLLASMCKQKKLRSTYVVHDKPRLITVKGQKFAVIPGFSSDFNAEVDALLRKTKERVVVVGHELFRGSVTDDGTTLRKGAKLADRRQVSYYAFGDLHIAQRVPGCKRAWYCGSPITHRFSDHPEKGYLIADTENPENPEFVDLHMAPQLRTVSTVQEALLEENRGHLLRLHYDPRNPPPDRLPKHIVFSEARSDSSQDAERVARLEVKAQLDDPLAGLDKFLERKKFSSRVIKDAQDIARELYEKLLSQQTDELADA